MDMSNHGLLQAFKVPGWFLMVWQARKLCWSSVFPFATGGEYTSRFQSSPQIKIWRTVFNTLLSYTSKMKCLCTYIVVKLFPCFAMGQSLLQFVESFEMHCLYEEKHKWNSRLVLGYNKKNNIQSLLMCDFPIVKRYDENKIG
jgi:hypothetical protein